MEKRYDVIVIGGGPAGYTAALYTTRAGLSTLVIEKLYAGGQMTQTNQIDNYPGFPEGIAGSTLGMKMQAGAERFGAVTWNAHVLSASLEEAEKIIETDNGIFLASTVIIATGAEPRRLDLPEEAMLTGKGIAYCAECDGMFYRGKTVAVVGGGNSAAADALLLSRIAKKVYLIHRRDFLRAEKLYQEQLAQARNVEFLWNHTVVALLHAETLDAIRLRNTQTNAEKMLEVDALFVSIGRTPATGLFRGQLELDHTGYIVAGESTETNLPGVFAAGDVRTKAVRQIITAAGDGAAAAHQAEAFLRKCETGRF